MSISRRQFLTRAAGTTGAVLLGSRAFAACSNDGPSSDAPGELTKVSFQLSWVHSVQFGGTYIAKEKGYFAQEGIDISLTPGGPNAPVEPPMLAGEALVGISAADYAGRAVAQGAPFKIIGVAMQKNPFVIASLVENPVNVPTDLIGKKLGMATINQPVLEALAVFNDLDLDTITVVPTQDVAAPLVNGEVDCLLCWLTDLPVAMTVEGIANTTMLLADFGYVLQTQAYIATEESLASRRAEIISLLRGEIRGWQDYKADTDAAAQLTVEMFPDLGLNRAAQTVQAAEQVKLMFSPDTDEHGFLWFTDESVDRTIATLGQLDVNVTRDFWDRSLLEEIFANGAVL